MQQDFGIKSFRKDGIKTTCVCCVMTHLLPGEWIIPSIIQTHQSQRPDSFCSIERPFQDLGVTININCGIKHSLLIRKCHRRQKVAAEQRRDWFCHWNCWSKKNRLGYTWKNNGELWGSGWHGTEKGYMTGGQEISWPGISPHFCHFWVFIIRLSWDAHGWMQC